jgi:hypothetical protein
LVNTGASAVIGLVVGAVGVALMHLLSFGRRGRSSPQTSAPAGLVI